MPISPISAKLAWMIHLSIDDALRYVFILDEPIRVSHTPRYNEQYLNQICKDCDSENTNTSSDPYADVTKCFFWMCEHLYIVLSISS